MHDSYDDLARRALRGDGVALTDLFALAESLDAEGRKEAAARAFRDAAIAYRVSAFRNRTLSEEAETRCESLRSVLRVYREWIEANPKGMRPLPRTAEGIDREFVRRTVVEELHKDRAFAHVFGFLYESLSSLGMEFYSPGGSLQRRVWGLLEETFGLAATGFGRYLADPSVRIGLDLLADEVQRRATGIDRT